MEGDKPLSVRLPKFKGTPERWPAWRDAMEAIFGAYKLIGAITAPRPVNNAPPQAANQVGELGVGEEPEGKAAEEKVRLHLHHLYRSHQQCHPDLHLLTFGTSKVQRFTCTFFYIRKTKLKLSCPNSEARGMELLHGLLLKKNMITKAYWVGLFSKGNSWRLSWSHLVILRSTFSE